MREPGLSLRLRRPDPQPRRPLLQPGLRLSHDNARSPRTAAQHSSRPAGSARLRKEAYTVSSISIIGTGRMAGVLGARALAGGNAVEVVGRDGAKAAALASELGGGATAGTLFS